MTAPTSTERDPVCGMNVDPATATHVHEHAGKKYYFCCLPCVEKFQASPQEYLSNPALSSGLVGLGMSAAPKAPHGQPPQLEPAEKPATSPTYVCPMCPEIRETKPG